MTFPVVVESAFEGGRGIRSGTGVTVAVSLYNYSQYIESTLDSVLRQTHKNLELIVVNDASSDDSEQVTLKWLKAHANRFTHALLLNNIENYGLARSRNLGFERAKNEFVFVLDADNQLYPRAIERLLQACENAGAQAAYSQLELFDGKTGVGVADIWDTHRLRYGSYVDAMALIRKSAWSAAGAYQQLEISGWEDYDLWCSFVEKGFEAIFVPQILCRYRIHESSLLRKETNKALDRLSVQMVLRHPWMKIIWPLPRAVA
jgi:glycosyltransferase involved in cell wall biosynthesis